jgi:dTDP-4-dehydrorhamnose reductase
MKKILVLGATGMLGSAVYTVLSRSPGLAVRGTVRSSEDAQLFQPDLVPGLFESADLEELVQLERLLDRSAPDVVINCLAARKPLPTDPMITVTMFAVLPQRLSLLCARRGARLIQMGTDGVFSGARGNYSEADLPDATDVYGVAKLLGEVTGPHAITLRTSIVGPELRGDSGLLEWFLTQRERCPAYARVVFSGLPTNVLAEIVRDEILPRPELCGVYHLAAAAISKFDLLRLIARRYGRDIELVPADTPVSDRSLDARRFTAATGYVAPEWPGLVDAMHSYHCSFKRT